MHFPRENFQFQKTKKETSHTIVQWIKNNFSHMNMNFYVVFGSGFLFGHYGCTVNVGYNCVLSVGTQTSRLFGRECSSRLLSLYPFCSVESSEKTRWYLWQQDTANHENRSTLLVWLWLYYTILYYTLQYYTLYYNHEHVDPWLFIKIFAVSFG